MGQDQGFAGGYLLDYFSSHKHPFPVKLGNLRELCGSDCATPYKWRQLVRRALAVLVRVGFLTEWSYLRK